MKFFVIAAFPVVFMFIIIILSVAFDNAKPLPVQKNDWEN
jgi:hypothetical protein